MKIKKRVFCIGIVFIIIGIGTLLLIHGLKKQKDNISQANQDHDSYALLENKKLQDISEVNINNKKETAISEVNVEKPIPDLNNNKVSDDSIIVSILEGIFAEKLKDLKGSQVDYFVFFANGDTNRDAIYFIDKLTYTKALYEGIDKESMSIELTFNNIRIDDSIASVELYENFDFMYTDGNGMPSSMGTIYDITLIKTNDDWHIDKMVSNDEFDGEYYEMGFELEELLDEMN